MQVTKREVITMEMTPDDAVRVRNVLLDGCRDDKYNDEMKKFCADTANAIDEEL